MSIYSIVPADIGIEEIVYNHTLKQLASRQLLEYVER